MSLLYVIRHGQAAFGNERYDQLSVIGTRQARLVGCFLRRCRIEFDLIFSGPKQRQIHTALAAMPEMCPNPGSHPIILEELSEYDAARIIKRYFEMEGNSADDAAERIKEALKDTDNFFQLFKKAVHMWFSGDIFGKDLESRSEFRARVAAGLARIGLESGEHKTIAVFTSGGVISAIMQEATGVSDETAFELAWHIRNASISVFEHRHGRLKLVSFNSVAHFELEEEPRLITYR